MQDFKHTNLFYLSFFFRQMRKADYEMFWLKKLKLQIVYINCNNGILKRHLGHSSLGTNCARAFSTPRCAG